MKPLRITVVQNGAGTDKARNLATIDCLLSEISNRGLIVLPEVFAGRGFDTDYRDWAEPLDGPLVRRLRRLARSKRAWLLAGSVIEKTPRGLFNTAVLINPAGQLRASYRKMHLFETRLTRNKAIREANTFSAGSKPVLTSIAGWKTGLAICYDLRFPELFRHYSARGAQLLLVPSNFTRATGKDHWEILVRARAIENQCFVVAANQCGTNPATGVTSYGHSMIVDPWGEIICKAGATECVLSADLDPRLLQKARSRIPALRHRVM